MMDTPEFDYVAAWMGAFIIALGLIIGLIIALVTPDVQEEICKYEGGEQQGEVCIVDGRVFEIKD